MILWLDCETKKPVTPKDGQLELGVEYAENWQDYKGMGVSCCCVQSSDGRAYVFDDGDLSGLQRLISYCERLVTFNGDSFDLPLLEAHGLIIPRVKSYDILQAYKYQAGKRVRLDDLARRNFIEGKTGDGAMAPVLYQQGKIIEVINYCFADVALTYKLYKQIKTQGFLLDPYSTEKVYLTA